MNGLRLLVALVLLGATSIAGAQQAGAVASACPLATRAGEEVLRDGGNAADAAVATALALAVTFPQAGNLGGGGFAVGRLGDEIVALDFREVAPGAATRDMYLDESGAPIPDASLVGPLSAGVPGSPTGLHGLHRRFGVLPWPRVVAPAIRLAGEGFVVNKRLADELAESRELLARFPSTREIWFRGGDTLREGQRVRQPDLARSLRAYARHGPSAITEGRIARQIERASSREGGILTAADLAAHRPAWREPVRMRLEDWDIVSMPLPSSGGTILGMTLGMLEHVELRHEPLDSASRAHLLAECWRRAYAARTLLGDPATTQATPEQLLDEGLLRAQAQRIDLSRTTPSHEVQPPELASLAAEPRDTTHLSVVDASGNAVALTTTLNGTFGSGFVAGRSGILLNNEMDDFATAPGVPNLYGLIQGEANEVGPGKRMLSSMSPTIAWRDGEILALGSPGGSRIPTTVNQVLLSVIADGHSLASAVALPRVHHQWMPDTLQCEPGALDAEARASLIRRGHAIEEVPSLGEVHAVRRFPDGRCEAVSDPRAR